jgi:pimeloyl-ACP methyl ester carboxylesterase
MGGMVAQEMAARHPGRVAALVLYATTSAFGGGDGSFAKQFLGERLAPLDRGLAPKDIAEDVVRGMIAPGAPPEALRRAMATMSTVTPAGYRASLECHVTFDRRADLEPIACPTRLLSATADKRAPAKTMARMAERIPGARLTCLDGLGHLAHLEAPERFNAALADFLGTLDGRGCTRA